MGSANIRENTIEQFILALDNKDYNTMRNIASSEILSDANLLNYAIKHRNWHNSLKFLVENCRIFISFLQNFRFTHSIK